MPTLPPFAELLDLVPDAVCVVDRDGHFLYVSEGFSRILGYSGQEILGRRTFDLVHPDDRAATMAQADLVMGGTVQRHFRNRYIHKHGHTVDIQWSACWYPKYGVRVALGREVTQLRLAERELERLASHDPLTGLLNRNRLQRELEQALRHAEQNDLGLALLYLDLDGFKAVNDRGGHDAGDRLLREIAERLQTGLRLGDLVARVGGDEFVVLLPGCRDASAAGKVADEIRERLRPCCWLPDGSIQLDASIGIACYPADGSDPDTLLRCADRAMYVAKRERRGTSG